MLGMPFFNEIHQIEMYDMHFEQFSYLTTRISKSTNVPYNSCKLRLACKQSSLDKSHCIKHYQLGQT